MPSDTLLATNRPAAPYRGPHPGPSVLIEVPLVRVLPRRPGAVPRYRRRRLKRQVRVGGMLLLASLPVAALGLDFIPARSTARSLRAEAGLDENPPVVSLSARLESVPLDADPVEPETPVVVKTSGYVLPDLSGTRQEGQDHAGR